MPKTALALPDDFDERLGYIATTQNIEALLQRLQQLFEITAESIQEGAAILKRIEELGGKIEVSKENYYWLRLVAYGQLHPGVFEKYYGKPGLMKKIAKLAIPDQKNFAERKPLKLMELNGDHLMVDPIKLNGAQIKQLFDNSRLRSDEEQVGYLREKIKEQQIAQAAQEIDEPFLVDRKHERIICRKDAIFKRADLLRMLSELE